jgi:predicted TIM-barrel fold metal-dependent hydrolase
MTVMSAAETDPTLHGPIPVVPEWLALREEPVEDPAMPIIDPHQHLWTRAYAPYLFDQYLADTKGGHQVAASVYVQCSSMYREDGPEEMKPLGEVEFANGMAAMSASGQFGPSRLCAGIVGFADLTRGKPVRRILESMTRVAGERFKGIRTLATWSPVKVRSHASTGERPHLLLLPEYQEGLAELADLGLSLDVLVFHTQLADVESLARSFPDTRIILNHAGNPVLSGPYKERREEMMQVWMEGMRRVSALPNVHVKLGGLASRLSGSMWHTLPQPPSSDVMAGHFEPFVRHCVRYFGAGRCMFESNFPVDKGQTSYRLLWNAFKKLAAAYPAQDQESLLWRTADDCYRLGVARSHPCRTLP